MRTAAARWEKRIAYQHRNTMMQMLTELAQSLLPKDASLPSDAVHQLDMLYRALSRPLGISPDDKSPPPNASMTAADLPDKRDVYLERDIVMRMAEELAQSLVPEDEYLPADAIHRLEVLYIELSHVLGVSPEDEGPPL